MRRIDGLFLKSLLIFSYLRLSDTKMVKTKYVVFECKTFSKTAVSFVFCPVPFYRTTKSVHVFFEFNPVRDKRTTKSPRLILHVSRNS